MKKAGVPLPAIVQLAKVQGKIHDETDSNELERLLRCDEDGDVVLAENATMYPKFVRMKQAGVATPFILQSAKNQGINDTTELDRILSDVDVNSATNKAAKNSSSGGVADSAAKKKERK